jgi:probable addiction module antidote protein
MHTSKFDAADYIDTPARAASYLALAFEEGDADDIRDAIAVVAHSRGMAKLAKAARLNEKSLYRTLGKTGNPEFATVMRLLQALGFTLTVKSPRQLRRQTPHPKLRKAG